MILRRSPYVVVDGCPVPRRLAPFVRTLIADTGATLESAYRGRDARGLLHRLGKSDQTELYLGWLRRLPGFNPASPPGRSTHELRSDGVAYAGPIGMKLLWWQCGLDFDDAHVDAVIRAAHRRGWTLKRPYSGGSEHHHVNFAARPRPRRLRRLLSTH